MRPVLVRAAVVAALVAILGCAAEARTDRSVVVPSASPTTVDVAMADFVAAADAVCTATFPKVEALADPDGEGGQKPLGLGQVVREWAEDLAAVVAPHSVAAAWADAMELIRQSGVALEEAERLAATGAGDGGGAAQSEALWSLQAQAAEILLELNLPFRVCSFT